MNKLFLISFLIFNLFVSSCSTERPGGKTEAEVLYKEAQQLLKDGRYLLATERLNQIKSQYPYSYYSTHAELLQADILYKQESYEEAASAYILFKDFHPKHKKLSYVIWKIAESFYNQLPDTFDRDLAPGKEAVKYYKELVQKFRKSKYIKDSHAKITEISSKLKKKEIYIADFYYKTDVFDAARHRYLDILKHFKDSEMRQHSMVRVVMSSQQLNDVENCKKYYHRFKSKVDGTFKRDLKKAFQLCK
jgi:outer membrane protein assembly factor BamD